jgi:hypothetical protein
MEAPSNSCSKSSIETLVAAYQSGDQNAANALIECVSPALYRFFALHSGDRCHADDLLQETWIRIHKARHMYRPENLFCRGSTPKRSDRAVETFGIKSLGS